MRSARTSCGGLPPCQGCRKPSCNGWGWVLIFTGSLKYRIWRVDRANGENQRTALAFRMGQDPGVVCRAYAAMTLWLLGYPAQALVRIHEALALAQELGHPYSLAYAWCLSAFVSQFRRDAPA